MKPGEFFSGVLLISLFLTPVRGMGLGRGHQELLTNE